MIGIHLIEDAEKLSLAVVLLTGLMWFFLAALTLMDRLWSTFAEWIGLWPYIVDAIWKFSDDWHKKRGEK